uniref:uncharacterized protein n=1 Tax=Pristiophorus japonicus TaxID=55135 RepID=UPI00398E4667
MPCCSSPQQERHLASVLEVDCLDPSLPRFCHKSWKSACEFDLPPQESCHWSQEGYFPQALQRIKRYEVEKVNEAIKNSVRTCSEQCGIQRIDYIDCTNCETKPVECGNMCSGQRALVHPMNTSAGESHTASETTAIIVLPILAAIILFLAALVGLYFCRKRPKNKDTEGKREMSKNGEINSSGKVVSKRRHLKKWKRRKWRKKHEMNSTD